MQQWVLLGERHLLCTTRVSPASCAPSSANSLRIFLLQRPLRPQGVVSACNPSSAGYKPPSHSLILLRPACSDRSAPKEWYLFRDPCPPCCHSSVQRLTNVRIPHDVCSDRSAPKEWYLPHNLVQPCCSSSSEEVHLFPALMFCSDRSAPKEWYLPRDLYDIPAEAELEKTPAENVAVSLARCFVDPVELLCRPVDLTARGGSEKALPENIAVSVAGFCLNSAALRLLCVNVVPAACSSVTTELVPSQQPTSDLPARADPHLLSLPSYCRTSSATPSAASWAARRSRVPHT